MLKEEIEASIQYMQIILSCTLSLSERVIPLFTDSQPVFNPHDGKEIEFELPEKVY